MTRVVVVGGGPAGLMAADVISAAGVPVALYERMPSVGRKLLMAGRGGLNLTHSEALPAFLDKYGAARAFMESVVGAFPPEALRALADGFGQETFVGSSGRVFPRAMKASPFLRAWLGRLARQGVTIHTRRRLCGFDDRGHPIVADENGEAGVVTADAVVLALGGASWPRLGSDGAWRDWLAGLGIEVLPFTAANVGVRIAWTAHFRDRFAGEPLKRIAVSVGARRVKGEVVVTRDGLEGGAVYALTPRLREALASGGPVTLEIDLRPDASLEALTERLSRPRGKQSMSAWLRKSLKLAPAAIGLLREACGNVLPSDPASLAALIKAVSLTVNGMGPLDRAISSAGGVALAEVAPDMMVRRRPGLFLAGEMLDWEAPTGGYLLQGCIATGHAAGLGVLTYLGLEANSSSADRVAVGAVTTE